METIVKIVQYLLKNTDLYWDDKKSILYALFQNGSINTSEYMKLINKLNDEESKERMKNLNKLKAYGKNSNT